MRRRTLLAVGLTGLTGCTEPARRAQRPPTPTATSSPARTPTPSASPEPPAPARFDAARALRTVRTLADIGPREATSANFRRAAALVENEFRAAGLHVERQHLNVPAGNSWGVDVRAGRTFNVVARPDGLRHPHLIVGAHLDTVPQAPGAEDNASGVAVLLELARIARSARGRVDVVFVAFGAEEPRGDGDAWHHFGSRAYVRRVDPRAVRAMVSLDRVGAGRRVRIRNGGGDDSVVDELVRLARRARIEVSQGENRASDHWSFEKAGVPAARVGGNPYAGYHSSRDTPRFVREEMLDGTGRLLWSWITNAG